LIGRPEARYRAAEEGLWTSLGVIPSERRVRLARIGAEVRVQELGAGAGPPVFFVHGASTCGTSWADLAARLPDLHCLLLDRPGTGLSDPLDPPIRGVADLVALGDTLVVDVLDGLGMESADLVTTSFGGFFGFRAALVAPARIHRIVEFGWSAGAPLGNVPLALRLGGTPPLGRLLSHLPTNDATVRRLFRGIGLREAVDGGRISTEAVRAYGALLRETDTMRNEVDIGGCFLSPARRGDPRLVLSEAERGRISAPVQFVWGEGDPFGGIGIAREFAAAFPNATLELLPGVGHAPWMDAAEQAARAVRAFLVTDSQ
jgi:pimeloyl-ACP methyl ester carboxylesterase